MILAAWVVPHCSEAELSSLSSLEMCARVMRPGKDTCGTKILREQDELEGSPPARNCPFQNMGDFRLYPR